MKEWLLNHIVLMILIIIIMYLLAATLPYVRHKKVAESYKEGFDPRECYGEGTGGERVAYVQDNIEAMIWRLKMIREAKQEIILSTFEFSPDEAGIDMMAAFLEAADRGVNIKILVDGTNAFLQLRGNNYFQAFVSHENVEIKIYNAFNFLKSWNLQARLHDKYVIIDKQMYLLGGRNTNNLFLGDHQEKKNIDREIFVYETEDDPDSSLYRLREYFERIWELPENKVYQSKKGTGKTAEAYQEIIIRIASLRELYPEAYQETDWLKR